MKSTLLDIQNNFSIHKYLGMESLRQTVVARLLATLGWDIWNPSEVRRDFQPLAESQTKLDFALFLQGKPPSAFVALVASEQMKKQLWMESIGRLTQRYNGIQKVSFLIVTDGRIWKFYDAQADRLSDAHCFATLDLLKNDNSDLEVTFKNFLHKSSFQSGSATAKAKSALGKPVVEETATQIQFQERLGTTILTPHILNAENPDDFRYTEIYDGRFTGTRCLNWNELVRFAIGFAYQSGISLSELQFQGNIRVSDPEESSFYPIPGTNLWLQTMEAKQAWSRTLAIAKILNVEVSVHFRWKNVVILQRRQQYGFLTWKPTEG